MSTVTEHFTDAAEVLFMSVARPLLNKKTMKEEYSVKIKVKSDSAVVSHLTDIANYKIDTKTNRANADSGETIINFTSGFAPLVVDSAGEQLKGEDIPHFDGRVDKGTVILGYKVIDYGDNMIVRLSAVKLVDLSLTPKEESQDTLNETLEKLKKM